jgi:hypothetical protein
MARQAYEFELYVYGNTKLATYTVTGDSEQGAVDHAIEMFEKTYPDQEVVDVEVYSQYVLE